MKIELVELTLPLPTLERICTDCARLVGPQDQPVEEILTAVSEFIFVTEKRFDEVIESAIGSVGQPIPTADDRKPIRAGKAISSNGPGGIVTSRVFIRESIVVPIVYYSCQPQDTVEECRYVISHEIGHSWDFFIRRVVPPKELTDDERHIKPFRIQTAADYHSLRLGFEVAACVNSVRAVSKELFSRRYKLTRDRVCECKEFIERELGKLRSEVVEAREASYLVNAALWSVLAECAKIFATMSANTRLSDGYRHPWVDTPWENVLRRHLEVVRTLVNSYPHWPADAMMPVRDVLRTLGTELFNCRFVEGESEDHVVVYGAD